VIAISEHVISFHDAAGADPDRVGLKAANLAALAKGRFAHTHGLLLLSRCRLSMDIRVERHRGDLTPDLKEHALASWRRLPKSVAAP
jgi:hypothetical protein